MTDPTGLTPEHKPVVLDTSLLAYVRFGASILYLGGVVVMILLRGAPATAALSLLSFGLVFLLVSSLVPVEIVATTDSLGVRRLFRSTHWYDKTSVRIITRPTHQPWLATFIIASAAEHRWWLRRFRLHLSWVTDGSGGDVTMETLRRMRTASFEQRGLFF